MVNRTPYIDVRFFQRCIDTLEEALRRLQQAEPDSINYDLYRSACIKEFEIILEQAGKLLKRALKVHFATPKAVEKLTFKDIFRHAAKHDLLAKEAVDRWLVYRDNRNNTAHDYGIKFAQKTLRLLPDFIVDANALCDTLNSVTND